MPRLLDPKMEVGKIGGLQKFGFSGVRTDHLGATEYTIVTIAVDFSSSVDGFKDELRQMLITAVKSCKKSPRSDNLLLRVILFSSSLKNGIEELHGFKPLADIDPDNDYPQLIPAGMTPLNDAAYSGIGATNAYAKKLMDDDFSANGIVFIITDGCENASSATAKMVREEAERAKKGEEIESLISILVGINAREYKSALQDFQKEAGITQYIDAGDVTEGKLAKLAAFVSQSVSSQTQALGTGGPSKNIAVVI